jgi:hypothetical protein
MIASPDRQLPGGQSRVQFGPMGRDRPRTRLRETTLRVNIDRLVLDGVPLERRAERALRASLEVELSSLLAAGPPPERTRVGGAEPSLPALQIPACEDPVALGRDIARALYRGLQQ